MTLRMARRLPLRYSPARRVALVGSRISLSCSVSSPASPDNAHVRRHRYPTHDIAA